MATFFGEVLPVVSRAIDDDDLEEFATFAPSPTLRWLSPEVTKANISSKVDIIMSFGRAASGFTQAYLVDDADIGQQALVSCEACGQEDDAFSQQSFSDNACHVLRMKSQPNCVFVHCNSDVKPDQYFAWTELVLSEIWKLFPDNCEKAVTVLCSSNLCEYKSHAPNSELTPPFLRTLVTDSCEAPPPCPYLETPNVVAGLPAQVLCCCRVRGVRAALYVCYVENSRCVDSTSMRAFKPTLATRALSHFKVNPEGDTAVLSLARQLDHYTTLYV